MGKGQPSPQRTDYAPLIRELRDELAALYSMRWSPEYGGGFPGEHGEMYEQSRREWKDKIRETRERVDYLERYAKATHGTKRRKWNKGKDDFVDHLRLKFTGGKMTAFVHHFYSKYEFPAEWKWTEQRCYRYVVNRPGQLATKSDKNGQ